MPSSYRVTFLFAKSEKGTKAKQRIVGMGKNYFNGWCQWLESLVGKLPDLRKSKCLKLNVESREDGLYAEINHSWRLVPSHLKKPSQLGSPRSVGRFTFPVTALLPPPKLAPRVVEGGCVQPRYKLKIEFTGSRRSRSIQPSSINLDEGQYMALRRLHAESTVDDKQGIFTIKINYAKETCEHGGKQGFAFCIGDTRYSVDKGPRVSYRILENIVQVANAVVPTAPVARVEAEAAEAEAEAEAEAAEAEAEAAEAEAAEVEATEVEAAAQTFVDVTIKIHGKIWDESQQVNRQQDLAQKTISLPAGQVGLIWPGYKKVNIPVQLNSGTTHEYKYAWSFPINSEIVTITTDEISSCNSDLFLELIKGAIGRIASQGRSGLSFFRQPLPPETRNPFDELQYGSGSDSDSDSESSMAL